MADQQQQGKGKGNPVFMTLLKDFPAFGAAWDAIVHEHPDDAETINIQSTQDANRHMGGGNGPIGAIHAVAAKIDDLLGKSEVGSAVAEAAKKMLKELSEAVLEHRQQQAKAAAEKKASGSTASKAEKVEWNMPTPESPQVTSLGEFLSGMPSAARKQRQAEIAALTDAQRASLETRAQQGITKRDLGNLITDMTEE